MIGVDSGISLKTENFPDKAWLIRAIATLSKGQDEIFKLDYVPLAGDIRRYQQLDQIMVNNDDGLLDVPDALVPKKHGRSIKMVTLSAADKIKAKLVIAEQKAER